MNRRRKLLAWGLIGLGLVLLVGQFSGRMIGGRGDWDRSGRAEMQRGMNDAQAEMQRGMDEANASMDEARAEMNAAMTEMRQELQREFGDNHFAGGRGNWNNHRGWFNPFQLFALPFVLFALMLFLIGRRRRIMRRDQIHHF